MVTSWEAAISYVIEAPITQAGKEADNNKSAIRFKSVIMIKSHQEIRQLQYKDHQASESQAKQAAGQKAK